MARTGKYPIKDGWIHAKLKTKQPFISKIAVMKFLDLSEDSHEIADFKNTEKSAIIIFRNKKLPITKQQQ